MGSTTSYSSFSTAPSSTRSTCTINMVLPLDYEVWQSLRTLLGWLSRNWHQPDAGCGCSGFSRTLRIIEGAELGSAGSRDTTCLPRGLPADEEVWIDQRDAVYEEVMSKGWSYEEGELR